MKTREDALALLNEYVKSESLKKHCLSVAASMEVYAKKYVAGGKLSATEEAAEVDKYWITGLLHDFDWEVHPTLEQHPSKGVKVLREKGWDEDICVAIMGHGLHTGVERESLMAKTLFAVDELSGLVVALARVRPGNFEGMKAKSVKKAMKKKDFAAAISRDDIRLGISELGVDIDEHFELVVRALNGIKKDLGF
jgi:predicted hydrolase (HD superfamily)